MTVSKEQREDFERRAGIARRAIARAQRDGNESARRVSEVILTRVCAEAERAAR